MSNIPFTVRRAVKWGECDPAGIVYTPRFLDWAVEGAESFFQAIIGRTWFQSQTIQQVGSPMAQASLTFKKPLKSGDPFDVVVTLDKVGNSSISYRIDGRTPEGETCFTASLTAVFVDLDTYRPTPMPDAYRAKFEAYRDACAARERAA
jgi:acyl-CoA thioesterase FadM